MSQADLSDADPSADTTLPPAHIDTDSCQDVSAALELPSASLQPPLIPESSPQSNEETTTEDTVKTDTSEGLMEPATEGQVIECDQPVSLEPDTEAAEEDVEVCSLPTVHQPDQIYEVNTNIGIWEFKNQIICK